MSHISAPRGPANNRIEIGASWRRCLCGLVLATALTLLFAVLLLEYDRGQNHFASIGFAFLMVVYALSAMTSVWYLVWAPAAIITVSPAGVRDVRISRDIIPWQSIERITTAPSHKWQRSVVLVLDKEFASTADLRLTAKVGRALNCLLGIEGTVISHHLLDVSADDLFKLLKKQFPYRPNANGAPSTERPPGREPVPTAIVLAKQPGTERRSRARFVGLRGSRENKE